MALTAPHPESWVGNWTWPLPGDASCARRARTLVVDTLASLTVPIDTVRDAELMVSELATNALQHADGHQPYELWLGSTESGELICAIFDTLRMRTLTEAAAVEDCDFGRGLGIVAALSNGRWGMYPTWSRSEPHVAGKAVWFGCPVTPPFATISCRSVQCAQGPDTFVNSPHRPRSGLS
jgi:hypothetical protein